MNALSNRGCEHIELPLAGMSLVKQLYRDGVIFLGVCCLWFHSTARSDDEVTRQIKALKSRDQIEQQKAVIALGESPDARAVAPLMSALTDPNRYVRSRAAEALGTIKNRHAGAVDRSQSPEALGNTEDARVAQALVTALKDESEKVRAAAAAALGYIQDLRAAEPLLAVLKDADARVRANAAMALGDIGDKRAVEPMLPLLQDGDAYVRQQAAAAQLDFKDARAVEALIVALRDSDVNVRRS